MIDMSKIPHDRVGLGSTVIVLDVEKDEKVRYKLVTSEDVDVAKGMISTSSPIGRGLLGKQGGRFRQDPDSRRRSGDGDYGIDHHSPGRTSA